MARIPLDQNDDWQLADGGQDVRGWDVRAQDGNALGPIDRLIVNTETEAVEAVVLADGSQYEVDDLRFEDGVAYLGASVAPTANPMVDHAPMPEHDRASDRPGDLDGSHRRAHLDPDRAQYVGEFHSHYSEALAGTGIAYEVYHPAYRYGQALAREPHLAGHAFEEVEPEVRRRYTAQFPDTSYEQVRPALRYGFEQETTNG